MSKGLRRWGVLARRRDGVALVEFALLVPVFSLLCVATIDFGMAFYAKLRLSQAVAQGAEYAVVIGGDTVSSAQVQTVVQSTTLLSPVSVTVTYDSAACYCLGGSPAAEVVQTCGANCPNGAPPGKYMDISASYTYSPIFGSYGLIADPVLTEKATVRVK